jgi:hypothetical protein
MTDNATEKTIPLNGIHNKKIAPIIHEELLGIISTVSDNTLKQLKEEAKYILENESEFKKNNTDLAGNIEKEYLTEKSKAILLPELTILANEFDSKFTGKLEEKTWDYYGLWMNFQKKYEHNPLHRHDGQFSFVLWIEIPYDLEEEMKLSNAKDSNNPSNSVFSFVYNTCFGSIKQQHIPVDKSYEGSIIIFPSNLNHTVYPFHTSDDYRISISGNLIPRYTP